LERFIYVHVNIAKRLDRKERKYWGGGGRGRGGDRGAPGNFRRVGGKSPSFLVDLAILSTTTPGGDREGRGEGGGDCCQTATEEKEMRDKEQEERSPKRSPLCSLILRFETLGVARREKGKAREERGPDRIKSRHVTFETVIRVSFHVRPKKPAKRYKKKRGKGGGGPSAIKSKRGAGKWRKGRFGNDSPP